MRRRGGRSPAGLLFFPRHSFADQESLCRRGILVREGAEKDHHGDFVDEANSPSKSPFRAAVIVEGVRDLHHDAEVQFFLLHDASVEPGTSTVIM